MQQMFYRLATHKIILNEKKLDTEEQWGSLSNNGARFPKIKFTLHQRLPNFETVLVLSGLVKNTKHDLLFNIVSVILSNLKVFSERETSQKNDISAIISQTIHIAK